MEKNQNLVESGEKITRKQAIKKVGVTALVASSLLLLKTNAHASASGVRKGNNGWGNGDQDPPGNSGPHNNAENSTKRKSWNNGEGNKGKK